MVQAPNGKSLWLAMEPRQFVGKVSEKLSDGVLDGATAEQLVGGQASKKKQIHVRQHRRDSLMSSISRDNGEILQKSTGKPTTQ